ncbi:MAG: energy transducer TonB [Bacteroidota bacterium]
MLLSPKPVQQPQTTVAQNVPVTTQTQESGQPAPSGNRGTSQTPQGQTQQGAETRTDRLANANKQQPAQQQPAQQQPAQQQPAQQQPTQQQPIAVNQPAETQPQPSIPPPTNAEANVAKVVNRQPEPISIGKPKYPEMAAKFGLRGTVIVKAQIDENGNVIKADVLKSPNPVFDRPAIDAAMKSKFSPKIVNDKPVPSEVTMSFVFKMQ